MSAAGRQLSTHPWESKLKNSCFSFYDSYSQLTSRISQLSLPASVKNVNPTLIRQTINPCLNAKFSAVKASLLSKKSCQNRKSPIGNLKKSCTFVLVFHRILDFKNGAEFLFRPHFFLYRVLILLPWNSFTFITIQEYKLRDARCELRVNSLSKQVGSS